MSEKTSRPMGLFSVPLDQPEFKLDPDFLHDFSQREVSWGPVGYVVYKRTYSRFQDPDCPGGAHHTVKPGESEEWWQTVARVVEGCYQIQQRHCAFNGVHWDEWKAQRSAQRMYELIFDFRFTPPGRGLWMMGTPYIRTHGSAALNNCGFISTENLDTDFTEPFTFLMDMSMLGVGVGSDTRGAGTVTIQAPKRSASVFEVPDTREGWVDAVRVVLSAYVGQGELPRFSYTAIRPEGEPIRGFGGVAAGPEPLRRALEVELPSVLDATIGKPIDAATIVDIHNIIGKCVVSGNVRRCLPEGALVHTEAGLLPIQDVVQGVKVLTSDGYRRVTETLSQGVQQTVRIQTQTGEFECTPNHRVAVLSSPTEYGWKRADELVSGDRMVFVNDAVSGVETSWPAWQYEKPDNSTTCVDITPPALDVSSAWFAGYVHGDGHVAAQRDQDGFNAHVSIAVADDEYGPEIYGRVTEGLRRFGVNVNVVTPRDDDHSFKVRAQSKQLAWYLDEHLKRPNESINIPDWVMQATSEVRAAYLAGLLDADGSMKTRPACCAVTVYPDYARQIRALYASLGIPVRVKLQRPARGAWTALYSVTLVGEEARSRFADCVAPYAVKGIALNKTARSQNDYGYPAEMIQDRVKWQGQWSPSSRQMTTATFKRCGGATSNLTPVEVLGVDPGREVATYDLSVEDRHEFVAEGMLVHNSAEIMFGEPDDETFLRLKDPAVAGEKMVGENSWRWNSNNSVFATVGMDYSHVASYTAKAGEPGYIWLSNIRDYGRMADAPDYKDQRAMGSNPCLTGDTLVHTYNGLRRIDSLLGQQTKLVVDGKTYSTTEAGAFRTGRKPVYLLETEEGHQIKLTGNHQMLVAPRMTRKKRYEVWVEAQDLEPGDKLILSNQRDWGRLEPKTTAHPPEDGSHEDEGWLIGNLVGDGHFYMKDEAKLQYWGRGAEQMLNAAERMLEQVFRRPKTGGNHVKDRELWSVSSRDLRAQAEKLGIDKDKNLDVEKLLTRGRNFIRGFVAGMFDADGSVQGTQEKGVSVRLSSVNMQHLRAVQQMLLALGINATIYRERRAAGLNELPDGRGGTQEYACQALHELVVAKDNLQVFADLIPLVSDKKKQLQKKLSDYKRAFNRDRFVATFRSLTYLGEEDVYDLTMEASAEFKFTAAGFVVHNCVEQTLESYELCCLCETYPAHHDSFEEYEETLKYAYLYAKTVTLLPTHNPRTNRVMMRNRRIGLSQSGIIQNVAKLGWRTHFEWCDRGYHEVQRLDKVYSDWLAVPRSIKTTSVKPSGTVSKLAGATAGIHYPIAEHYILRIRFAKTSPMLKELEAAGYEVHDCVYNPATTRVVEFPVKEPYFYKAEDQVSMWEQLAAAAQMQKWWADNQVSCTIKFDGEHEGPQVSAALALFDDQLKGISFLHHAHGYAQAPQEAISADEYDRRVAQLEARRVAFTGETHETTDAYCDGAACEVPAK